MAKKPKILVVLLAQRLIFARTTSSLVQAAMDKKDWEFDFYMEMGCDIASARNRSVRIAREREATHLMFVDYDMYFPPHSITKLLMQNKDIIGACYNFRGNSGEPPKCTAVPLTQVEVRHPHPDEIPKETFKCHCMGTGFMLIKIEVFDKFKAPWFLFGYDDKGELVYGEDTYFGQRAIKEGGFEIWADPTLNVKHVGEQLF